MCVSVSLFVWERKKLSLSRCLKFRAFFCCWISFFSFTFCFSFISFSLTRLTSVLDNAYATDLHVKDASGVKSRFFCSTRVLMPPKWKQSWAKLCIMVRYFWKKEVSDAYSLLFYRQLPLLHYISFRWIIDILKLREKTRNCLFLTGALLASAIQTILVPHPSSFVMVILER